LARSRDPDPRALPDRARCARRPGLRLRRRRRRLSREAVRVRRARRAAPGVAAPRGERRCGRGGGTSTRSGHSLRRRRQNLRGADADRVPTARAAARPPRRSRAPPRPRASRLATRCDRAQQHARRVRRAAAPEAAHARRSARNRDRARRRLPRRMSGLGIRRRLFLVVVVTVAAALAALVFGFNLILGHTLDRDSRDLAPTRASAQLGLLAVSQGRLTVREAPDDAAADAYICVLSNGALLERPRASATVDAAARALADGEPGFADVASADIRLYAAPVRIGGHRVGTVVAGVSLAPYEETRRLTLIGSLVFGAIVLGLVALATRWLVGSSLRPVQRMTRQAAAWSEHDLQQRFGLGDPHDELTE